MNNLRKVAEAILDSANSEYYYINTASISNVQDYADNALSITISDYDAKYILRVCNNIKSYESRGEIISSNDYHNLISLLDKEVL